MKNEDLDRFLSADQDIVPSSGFVSTVMNAVQDEANAPPPIPFPWKRAIPGFAAAAFVLVFIIVRAGSGSASQASPLAVHVLDMAKMSGVVWIFLALLLTLGAVALPMLLIRKS
jgi:hypothetical protein